jgi:hypothetical protein
MLLYQDELVSTYSIHIPAVLHVSTTIFNPLRFPYILLAGDLSNVLIGPCNDIPALDNLNDRSHNLSSDLDILSAIS